MSNQLVLMCTYGDVTAVSMMFQNYVLSDLVQFVCRKWTSLRLGDFSLYYSLPPYSKCILDSDYDLQNMVALAYQKGIQMVDIAVMKNCSVGESFVESVATTHESSTLDCGGPSNPELDLLPTFCRHEKSRAAKDDWKNKIHSENQCFEGGIVEFRRCLQQHAICVGYEYVLIKNQKERVCAVCQLRDQKNCMWRVYASLEKSSGYAYIRKLNNEHTCGAGVGLASNRRISSNLVCHEILELIRVSPGTTPIEVVGFFLANVGLDISYYLAWMGVEKARAELFGDHAQSFDQLRWYFGEALKTNAGSHFSVDTFEDSARFRRCFVCFDACIQGFKFCRPMLFLDGTHLKGRYKGTLLAATAKDGNNGLYPFAFAIVSNEDEDNWIWFLEELVHVVGFERILTFVSDRNQGLLNAVQKVFPTAYHGYCLEHLKRNLRDRLKSLPNETTDQCVNLFRNAAYSPDKTAFYKKLSALKHIGGIPAINFLNETPKQHWAHLFFVGQRYGEMTSNAAESFNSMIEGARSKPIAHNIDMIRTKLMKFFAQRRVEAASWNSVLCPIKNKSLKEAVAARSTWIVNESTNDLYEVLSDPSVYVNLRERTCVCGQWQYNGFICSHAVAAITKAGRNIYDYVESYFFVSSYRDSYARAIGPVPTMSRPRLRAADVVIRPPTTKRPSGRPKKRRIRKTGEDVEKRKCSRCNIYTDHNRATCTAEICYDD